MTSVPAVSAARHRTAAGPRDAEARQSASGRAFAERLTNELPRLTRLALRLVRDPARAEDIVQEAAMRAWAKQDLLREGAPIGPWLDRIAVNLVIDRARKRRDELDLATVEDRWRDDDYTVDPARVLANAELREELEDALARLPVGYRSAVVLHDAMGLTTAAVADALGIGLPAAKQRLRRGRMMLVSALAEDDPRRTASVSQPMRCWKARRQISAYLDDELPAAGRQAVEEHLADCPTCPPLYASLMGLQETMGDLRDADKVVPEEIAARITRILHERLGD